MPYHFAQDLGGALRSKIQSQRIYNTMKNSCQQKYMPGTRPSFKILLARGAAVHPHPPSAISFVFVLNAANELGNALWSKIYHQRFKNKVRISTSVNTWLCPIYCRMSVNPAKIQDRAGQSWAERRRAKASRAGPNRAQPSGAGPRRAEPT